MSIWAQRARASIPRFSRIRTLLEAGGGRVASFIYDESDGNSIYHALQTRLVRRFAKGVSMNALYTFSKSIDDASTIGGGTAVVAQNPFDLSAERGLSSFDQRHTLNLSYILASPVGGPSAPLHSFPWAERAFKRLDPERRRHVYFRPAIDGRVTGKSIRRERPGFGGQQPRGGHGICH